MVPCSPLRQHPCGGFPSAPYPGELFPAESHCTPGPYPGLFSVLSCRRRPRCLQGTLKAHQMWLQTHLPQTLSSGSRLAPCRGAQAPFVALTPAAQGIRDLVWTETQPP